ncbi:MAG: anhydro-N-acetylmuramic acid kinase [Deltaproteobacteria bacterium]|nr:MAG: anhydro-N-acetylmuramic acid kinase [Deltaproteobacteria bacterium]
MIGQLLLIPCNLKKRILKAATRKGGSTEEVCRLNMEIGEVFAKATLSLLKKTKISSRKIYAIGSHGQTICHLGREGTLQIGESSVIAERTSITTVADFRPADIASGGLGAPLIPYFHSILFQQTGKSRAVHNIGGISNLTFLPKGSKFKGVFGFDTGPGNMLMDAAVVHFTKGKKHFDDQGKIAAKGFVSLMLLKELMSHSFIAHQPPKTAGREEFGHHLLEKILKRSQKMGLRFEDILATLTAFTAQSIAENYRRFVFPKEVPEEIIFWRWWES